MARGGTITKAMGFNEAGGFLPRKRGGRAGRYGPERRPPASMRPEDFSPGNGDLAKAVNTLLDSASMRPEDFSPGNDFDSCRLPLLRGASMRPEDFSPGNLSALTHVSKMVEKLQ